jgi:hypothetical protein
MEFQITPDTGHLFADAIAAFIRGHADTVWLNEQSKEWHELYETFRDADTASVTVSCQAGQLIYMVWGTRWAWRDEQTRLQVKAELRPQWQEHMWPSAINR